MKLAGQTLVVTGAGSGIGRAIALRFAQEGARVVIGELREEAGRQAADEIVATGGEALAVPTDVTDAQSVKRLFAACDVRGWDVDMLITNAGTAEPSLLATAEVSDDRWASQIAVHLTGTFHCAREALSRMTQRKQGSIVTIASVAGLNGLPGSTAYSAAKGGIISMTKALSQEVAPQGIRVNCIAPGWINTPMLEYLPEKWRPGMITHTPLGRLGEPADVAALALFLASSDSDFVTGQVVSPNGGMFRW